VRCKVKHVATLDHDGRKRATVGRATVEVDPVAVMRRCIQRSVTVYDQHAMVTRICKEVVANPEQVRFNLIFQSYTWAYTRVDKYNFPTFPISWKVSQKFTVR